ncbi:MAG TPA: hypothetical protein VFX48_00320, partial [Saprospiraceae bacterium]|nr:hypothetical protein [Saprospiraceae bacterium]
IFAATNLGIYKSLDGGDNWSSSLNLPLTMDLLIDESEPEILYTGVGGVNNTHYGVYKTLDGGNRWELVSTPNDTLYQGRIMLARYKKNPKRIYALYSDAFRSIGMMRTLDGFDQTKFYTPVKNISSHQGWYAKGLLIKDDDSTKILAGGVDVYLDTTGTGNQFFNLILRKIKVHADVHDIISNPLDPDKVYLATDGGLFRSDDFAETFYACNGGFLSTQFYTGSVSIRSDQLVGGLQDNRSAVLRDPQPWSLIHLGDGTFNAIDPANDSILYLSSQYQNLYRSTTMGTSWKQLIPPNNQAAFVAPFALHPRVKGLLYSGGNHLLRSYDEGNNWDTIALPESGSKITALEVSASEPNLVVFATIHTELGNSNLYISNARGEILRSIGASIPDRFIRDICIDPSDPRHFIIALGGSGIPGVMESYDAGFSWMFTENTGLPDIPIHSLLIDPKYPEIYYAGTEFGLYASPNKGKKWISFNTHPYDLVPVYDLKYSEIRKKLILFTHGYGAFQLPLLDPTLITSSEQVDSRAWIFDPLEKAIILPDDSKFNEIYLISLSGQVQKLFAEGNKISLRSASPGIYFLKTKSTGSKPERIFLPE